LSAPLRRPLVRLQGRRPQREAEPSRPAVTATAASPWPVACATVVIPALNEAARIASVVRHALADPATAEVIVIDDSSIDDTALLARQAGAEVITSTMLGKGASMRDGVAAARCDIVVYLDGDLAGLRAGLVGDLCQPLVQGAADFVKARFGRSGGRVTELTARPMLQVFFPELVHFAQPLGGLVAARRDLLKNLPFEDGYGVDIGLLLDAHAAGARLAEVDIGTLDNDSQPLHDLTAMANEVSRVIYSRARVAGRLHMAQITAMYEAQRQATATLVSILARRRGRTRILLIDLEDTVSTEHPLRALAHATGHGQVLAPLLDRSIAGPDRDTRIAALFRFVHRQQFEHVAHALPIRPGAIACINHLRRAGFMVGLICDGPFVMAEILRRRVFADFALAHTLEFEADVCTGTLRPNAAFLPVDASPGSSAAGAGHVIAHLRRDAVPPAVQTVWVLGQDVRAESLLQQADRAFVLDPAAGQLAVEARTGGTVRIPSFDALTQHLDAWLRAGDGDPVATEVRG